MILIRKRLPTLPLLCSALLTFEFQPSPPQRLISVRPTGDESSTQLGLHIVYKIVTDCGGTICAESQVGKGSAFTVSFPLCEVCAGVCDARARAHANVQKRCLYIQNCPASIFHSPPIAHAGSTEVCVRMFVCSCVRVCACMYDYYIAVSFKTLAPFESVCAVCVSA